MEMATIKVSDEQACGKGILAAFWPATFVRDK